MNATREKILTKALELFNKKGVEYVGMRELAAALDMRIGNVTYYFPTKDDLVFNLSEAYSASNSQIHQDFPTTSLFDFLKKSEALFRNSLRYQCLMLSMVHLMEQNQMIVKGYENTLRMRTNTMNQDARTLDELKFLKLRSDDEHWVLVSTNSLLNRFWLSEAALSGNRTNLESQMGHYLKLKANLFKPYATKKGLADIERFLHEV